MKNILFLTSLAFALVLSSCSSDRDNVEIKEEWPVNKTIPSELMGNWKINYVVFQSDPEIYYDNSFGCFFTVKTDNKIEYYDANKKTDKKFTMTVEEVSGNTIENGKTTTLLSYLGTQKIVCNKSSKYPGQVEFKIIYPNGSPYMNTTLIGIRQ